MTVSIPEALRSYTAGRAEIEAGGDSLAEILTALDRRYPGIRFRIITEQDTIRPHIRLFLNNRQVHTLTTMVRPDDHLHIICALSGG